MERGRVKFGQVSGDHSLFLAGYACPNGSSLAGEPAKLFTICLMPAGFPIKALRVFPSGHACNLGQVIRANRPATGPPAGIPQAAPRLPISNCMPGPIVVLTDTRLI